tara:strand:- start:2617 stop:2754 length:138 start_codon:yes stop_codon:yes gene_type:complete
VIFEGSEKYPRRLAMEKLYQFPNLNGVKKSFSHICEGKSSIDYFS